MLEERDVEKTIYEVPLVLSEQGLDELVLVHFRMARPPSRDQAWLDMVKRVTEPKGQVRIGVVGKYSELQDAYKSIFEAIDHGGIAHQHEVIVEKIAAEDIETGIGLDRLNNIDGLLVPGGFGDRGFEGKIKAVQVAREKQIPFFGICLGLQTAVIEFARNVCGLEGANSTEMDPNTPHPVVNLMEEQKSVKNLGGTMRLGAWDCHLSDSTFAQKAYGKKDIAERHRHRYEVNNDYRDRLAEKGLVFSGINQKADLVEIVEIKEHPWFLATQFHPEFKSQPTVPHPLFKDFIGAVIEAKLVST